MYTLPSYFTPFQNEALAQGHLCICERFLDVWLWQSKIQLATKRDYQHGDCALAHEVQIPGQLSGTRSLGELAARFELQPVTTSASSNKSRAQTRSLPLQTYNFLFHKFQVITNTTKHALYWGDALLKTKKIIVWKSRYIKTWLENILNRLLKATQYIIL